MPPFGTKVQLLANPVAYDACHSDGPTSYIVVSFHPMNYQMDITSNPTYANWRFILSGTPYTPTGVSWFSHAIARFSIYPGLSPAGGELQLLADDPNCKNTDGMPTLAFTGLTVRHPC